MTKRPCGPNYNRHWLSAIAMCTAVLLPACASDPGEATASAPTDETPIAFVGAAVLAPDGQRFLHNHTLLVRGHRIEAVGPAESIALPATAEIVPAHDRFLIPGLADMHVHLEHFDREGQLLLFPASGVTTVRHMDGRPRELEWRRRVADGSLLGPTIHMAGRIIDSEPRPYDQTTIVTTAEAAAAAVREQASDGYDFIKVYHRLAPEAYRAIVDTARALGLPVAGHVPHALGLRGVLDAGQGSIEHLYGYGEVLIRSEQETWAPRWMVGDLDRAALRSWTHRTARAGTWNGPTLVVRLAARPLAEAQRLYDSAPMALVPPTMKEGWNYQYYAYAFKPPEAFSDLETGKENRRAVVKALFDAGAPLLAGTDTPNLFVEPGFALHRELAEFVKAGLSPAEALRIATAGAAEFLGQSREFGVIQPGARADLLLLGGNPLNDIEAIAGIEGVMVRGRWLDRAELAGRMAALTASYHRLAPDIGQWRPPALGSLPADPDHRYLVRLGAYPVAQEQLWFRDGLIGIAGHEEADDPDVAIRIRLSDHGRELARDIWLRSNEGEGRLRLSAQPLKDAAPMARWVLEGSTPSGKPVAIEAVAPAGAIVISVPSAASAALLKPYLRPLAVGDMVTVPALVLGFRPDIEMESEALQIERLPDRSERDSSGALAAYRLAAGYDERVLLVDGQFDPVGIEEELPLDTKSWARSADSTRPVIPTVDE